MSRRRNNYMKRVKTIEKMTAIRNIFFTFGALMFLPLVLTAEADNLFGYWVLMLTASVVSIGISVFLEYVMLYCISHEGDIKVSTIFAWSIEYEDRSYKTWLKTHKLKDSVANFNRYYSYLYR